MAKYDPNKDEVLMETIIGDATQPDTLIISLCQYNGGTIKLSIMRTYSDWRTQEIKRKNAGRLVQVEVEALQKVLPELLQAMDR